MTFAPFLRTVELILLGAMLLSTEAFGEGLPSFAQPAMSPDGKEIAFVSGGSIWTVPAEGGDAHLLVTQTNDVARPLYSPDGKRLAFISMATGNGDIYVVQLETGQLKHLTFDDASDRLDAWSADSKTIYFSTNGHNVGPGASDIYSISADGGTPMPAVSEDYQNVFYSAVHPDGHTVAFCANGMAATQWWRHGHSHDDESEIWTSDGRSHFSRLTDFGAKNIWPSYSPDGCTLYFMSDRDGQENIWSVDLNEKPATRTTTQISKVDAATIPAAKKLTHFHDGRLLWPTLCANGKTMVFERDFGVWTLDLATGESHQVPVHLRGIVADPAPEHTTLKNGITELAMSHDGRKIAFVMQGQVFATISAGGNAFRVTQTTAVESHIAWSNDDRKLAYASTRDGPRHIYLYDFTDRAESRMTDTAANDSRPVFSPNDAVIAFERDGRQLRLLSISSLARRKQYPTSRPYPDKMIADELSLERPPFDAGTTPFVFSAAGDWIAYVSGGAKGFRNVNLVATDGSAPPQQVSFLANAQSESVAWTPDGTSLYFGSGQRTEDFQLARVDLTPQTAKFKDDQFSDLFKDRPTRPFPDRTPRQPSGEDAEGVAPPSTNVSTRGPATAPSTQSATLPTVLAEPSTKPAATTRRHATPVIFDNIEQRLSLLPIGVGVGQVALSPDGKALAFIGASGRRANIYLYPIDPTSQRAAPRQLTSTADDKSFLQFAPDASGPRLYYLENDQIHWVGVTKDSTPQDVPVTVEFDQDFNRSKMIAFDQAWRYLNENFHDPSFNGVDWKAIHDRFEKRITAARTALEERRLLSLMIGELNASHLSAGSSSADVKTSSARLGLVFDLQVYRRSGVLRITTVVPSGPAALSGITVGKYIISVDGKPATRPANLDALLDHKIDKEVLLTLDDSPDGKNAKDVRVTAISASAERTLGYQQWVRDNREYVKKISNGRLGYVHIVDMSEQALARLNVDLDARNETHDGVVVDIRNNNGGFVNGMALDVFTRRNYLFIEPRGFPKMTGRAALGQRYLGLPTILVTNRETLSDGEDFTEGYQALGLGDTVGEPTAGWIIFTRGCSLIDGTQFRVPSETVYDHKGQPMEMHPRPVTFPVDRPVNEPESGKDCQLDEAVKRLLAKMDVKS